MGLRIGICMLLYLLKKGYWLLQLKHVQNENFTLKFLF